MTTEGARCTCEQHSHGELGVVEDGERVARVVTSPNHIRKDGTLKPGTFPKSHIAQSGLSLMRVDHMNVASIETVSEAIAGTKAGETLKGLAMCKAEGLRSITDEGTTDRSLCVVDDPVLDDPSMPDNPAHAIAIKSAEQDEAEILRIQGMLLDLFGGVTPIASVHEG